MLPWIALSHKVIIFRSDLAHQCPFIIANQYKRIEHKYISLIREMDGAQFRTELYTVYIVTYIYFCGRNYHSLVSGRHLLIFPFSKGLFKKVYRAMRKLTRAFLSYRCLPPRHPSFVRSANKNHTSLFAYVKYLCASVKQRRLSFRPVKHVCKMEYGGVGFEWACM